jgi:hypothetical protein
VLPFVLIALSFAWWLARRWSKPGTKRAARVAAFGIALGNALVDIAAMLQPERPTAAEIQRVREEPTQRERDKRKPMRDAVRPRTPENVNSKPPRPSARPRS